MDKRSESPTSVGEALIRTALIGKPSHIPERHCHFDPRRPAHPECEKRNFSAAAVSSEPGGQCFGSAGRCCYELYPSTRTSETADMFVA